jgi:cell surface protein SprA
LYTQKAIASYTLPLSKFPLTDWINARYSYTTTYNWIGASRLALSLGNTIENSQENTVNGEFDFTRLYSKSRILRSLENAPAPKTKGNTGSTKTPTVSSIQIKPKAEVLKGLTGEKRTIALKNGVNKNEMFVWLHIYKNKIYQ